MSRLFVIAREGRVTVRFAADTETDPTPQFSVSRVSVKRPVSTRVFPDAGTGCQ